MDLRPVYWILCGVGIASLTPAWGGRQIEPMQNNQNVLAQTGNLNSDHAQLATNISLLAKRQPWSEPKSDPFSNHMAVEENVSMPISDKLAVPEPLSFPYVFIGKLFSEEKNAVFLSKSNQIYTVAAGDVLGGVYQIEHIGRDALEVTYLPEHKKLSLSFDSLATKSVLHESTLLAQSGAPAVQHVETQAPPADMVGEIPSVENGQLTDDLRQMLAPAPPPQGDVLEMMGATQQPQGDALKMMAAPEQPVQGAAGPAPAASAKAVK